MSTERSDEILRLLGEVRDLQREHIAEYKRISAEAIQINRTAAERADAQYRASLKSAQASTWGIFILIAVCLAANLFMIIYMKTNQ
jgi:hypothetical protein